MLQYWSLHVIRQYKYVDLIERRTGAEFGFKSDGKKTGWHILMDADVFGTVIN